MPVASRLTCLVVDDQMTIRAIVRQGLSALNFGDVHEAADGEEGLKFLITRKVDLVVSDFNMPNLDGLGLLRAIRAHPPIATTAFIMLTGRADKDLVARAVQYGANNYLVKPFSTQTLREKIEAVFGALT